MSEDTRHPADSSGHEILSVAQMYEADRYAIAAGTPGEVLMENAGRAVADYIRSRWAQRPAAVLCGPGNNGGDGFVIARYLSEAGWPVTVAVLRPVDEYSGDAGAMAKLWTGQTVPLTESILDGQELVIDALFGAGLDRPLSGPAFDVLAALSEKKIPTLAVDVPSGVHGDSGAVLGHAVSCAATVTFFRRKPAHLLMPGRSYCGDVIVADIGIPQDALPDNSAPLAANVPGLWEDAFPWPGTGDHKYGRGHLVIVGGAEMTGAGRLAARAAARIGAGLVTVASPPGAVAIYASDFAGLLVMPVANEVELAAMLEDRRKNAVLVGPGGGVSRTTRMMALAAMESGRSVVLDADALTVFADDPPELFEAATDCNVVMTPHEGEFSRLFDIAGSKVDRARNAAAASNAVILLKGADTVIAAPDGRAVINENAPPTLATAGSGDVLSGLIAGLMAQGMAGFEAACAACWCHGDAAARFGPGLIASDITEQIPAVLRKLQSRRSS